MILFFLAWFLAGVLMQLTDFQVDVRKKSFFKHSDLLAGAGYGVLAGFLAFSSPSFASLIFALVVAMLICGKIDCRQHQFAVASLLAALFLLSFACSAPFSLPRLFFPAFVLLSFAAFADEILHDRFSGKKRGTLLSSLLSARLLAEAAGLFLWLWLGDYSYFLALLSLDVGAYVFADKFLTDARFMR